MTIDEALMILESLLAPNRLSSIQELVFRHCWAGQTYRQIAEGAGYDSDYVRVIGSRLWQNLSETLGERVTKNNIQAVLRHQSQQRSQLLQQQLQQQFQEFQQQLQQHSQKFHLYPEAVKLLPTKGKEVESRVGQNRDNLTREIERMKPLGDGIAYDFPGSPLQVGSPLYVMRPPLEEQAYGAITQPGMLLRIRAPEKWGKTSLLDRILHQAQKQPYAVVRLNFQQADGAVLEDLERLLRWFCANITQQLHLKSQLDEYWDADLGSKVSCTTYMQEYILEAVNGPLVIALDDVQRLFEYPEVAKDFLPMLRVWHEESKNIKIWTKLRLIVVYSTEVCIPIEFNQSPFNVGFPMRLRPFTLGQTWEFASRYGFDWLQQQDIALQILRQLHSLVDGHPYLLHLAFYALSRQQVMVEQLWEEASKSNGIYGEHLRNYLHILQTNPSLAKVFRAVILADEAIELEAIAAHKLESMGLVKLYGDRVEPSCQLYRSYFVDRLTP